MGTVEDQIEELEERKEALVEANEKVDETIIKLEQWIEEVEPQKDLLSKNEDIDSLVQASDVQSQQMITLASKNAAIADCLYFLDRALAKGTISFDVHIKRVRILAKKQFLVRAHLLKIAEIRSNSQR